MTTNDMCWTIVFASIFLTELVALSHVLWPSIMHSAFGETPDSQTELYQGRMEFIEKTALRVQELVEKEITHFGMIQRPLSSSWPACRWRSTDCRAESTPAFASLLAVILPSPFRKGKPMKLRSVMATVCAFGAVTFQLIANIPPARAADSVRVRSTIVSPDGSMLTVKTSRGRDHRRGNSRA